MEQFLADWETQAMAAPSLTLSFDISSDQAEYVSHAFPSGWPPSWPNERRPGGTRRPRRRGTSSTGRSWSRSSARSSMVRKKATIEFGDYLRTFWPRSRALGQGI